MIPKIIHYCWFGGNEKPELALKCIESWKKYCPDYTVIEWNEDNYNINSCQYIREAYEKGKWAFVSDYARFDILYEHGGVYFDTDVELIRPINDILEKGQFMGMEDDRGSIASGLGLALDKGNKIAKEIIDSYRSRQFIQSNGFYDQTNVVSFVTDIFKEKGYIPENRIQNIEGITIYTKDYFCPLDYDTGELNITSNTRSIHHYISSWKNEREKKWHKFSVLVHKRYSLSTADSIMSSYPVRLIGSIYRNGLISTIRMAIGKGVR